MERVLSLKPRRVREIGCGGSGLMLFRIAPHSRRVHGHGPLRQCAERAAAPVGRHGAAAGRGAAAASAGAQSGHGSRVRGSGAGGLGGAVFPERRVSAAGIGNGGGRGGPGRQHFPGRCPQLWAARGLSHFGGVVPRGACAFHRRTGAARPQEHGGGKAAYRGSFVLPRAAAAPPADHRGRDEAAARAKHERAHAFPVRRDSARRRGSGGGASRLARLAAGADDAARPATPASDRGRRVCIHRYTKRARGGGRRGAAVDGR